MPPGLAWAVVSCGGLSRPEGVPTAAWVPEPLLPVVLPDPPLLPESFLLPPQAASQAVAARPLPASSARRRGNGLPRRSLRRPLVRVMVRVPLSPATHLVRVESFGPRAGTRTG